MPPKACCNSILVSVGEKRQLRARSCYVGTLRIGEDDLVLSLLCWEASQGGLG